MKLKDEIIYNVMKKSREKKFNQFMDYFNPTEKDTVLDAGMSTATSKRLENYFIETYPYPEKLTGLGIGKEENFDKLRKLYPKVKAVSYNWLPEKKFPFEDNQFDIVFSNAVIEHVVRTRDDQKIFFNELLRVSKKGLMTTPNKWFPIEPHYRLPFVHWRDNDKFDSFARKYLKYLGPIRLLGKKDLIQFCEELNVPNYEIKENNFFGLPMTLSVFWNKEPDKQ